MIEIKITDTGVVEAFNRLIALGENPYPALKGIGEKAVEFTKDCFQRSADPYGAPWAPLKSRAGKPLIGEGKSLSTQFAYRVVGNDTVQITSLMGYAALHNFGGTVKPKNVKALFFMVGNRKVFAKSVTIPARPFFPNEAQGLPDGLSEEIADVLRSTIQSAMTG